MNAIIRNDFPDLTWLKNQVNHRFVSGKGWPNVILNVNSGGCRRPDILGPFSLFLNIKGQSTCIVQNHHFLIPETCYFISNNQQPYSLLIDEKNPAETFNIHFGEDFLEKVYAGVILTEQTLLDNPVLPGKFSLNFFNKLYPRDLFFNRIIRQLYELSISGNKDNLRTEELMAVLLRHLLQVHQQVEQEITKLPAIKATTQKETYRRLSYSVDYMQAYFAREISLEELAGIACLSKFHYLRLFQAVFNTTPYHYLTQIRLQKAKQLLRQNNLPVNEIALQVGFVNPSSFSRVFQKTERISASAFRAAG